MAERESKTEKGKARELVCYARGREAHTEHSADRETAGEGNYREKCEQPQLFTMIATVNTGTVVQYTDNKS